MKVCNCGGRLLSNGHAVTKFGGKRYKCPRCGHSITVRDGVAYRGGKPVEDAMKTVTVGYQRLAGRPFNQDFRMA